MDDIKTRESIRDVKVFDRVGDLEDHVRTATVRSRETLDTDNSESAETYAEEQVEQGVSDTADVLRHETEHGIERGREAWKEHQAEKAEEEQFEASRSDYTHAETETYQKSDREIRTRETSERDIKTRDKSVDKDSVKTVEKSAKKQERSVKTAEASGKKTVKTAEKGVKEGAEAPKKTKKAAERLERIRQAIVDAAKKVVAAVKAAAVAVKGAVAFLAAGGWIVVVLIAAAGVICAICMSVVGIFFGGSEGRPLHKVVTEITAEYQDEIDLKRVEIPHDRTEVRGARAPWKEVLSVFAVKTVLDPLNPVEVLTMTKEKETRLRTLFNRMNIVTTFAETRTAVKTVIVIDEDGNETEEEQEVEERWLVIEVQHKTAWEMADYYRFNDEQRKELAMLLEAEYDDYWMNLIYRYHTYNYLMVESAKAEVGNVGGEKYWRWYGFSNHVEWCAVFVCWLADQHGYIDEGFCPKFSQCAYGVRWFMEHDRWIDGAMEPLPGMLIFFDWDTPDGKYGPQDAHSDHVGIVEKVEDGIVYTIEGNCQDECKRNQYPVGWYEIMGYGGIR